MIPTKKATSNLFWDENVIVWFSNPEGYLITIRRKNISKYRYVTRNRHKKQTTSNNDNVKQQNKSNKKGSN
jgi:hypothetical protein